MNQETTKKIEEEYRLVYGEEHPGVVSANKSTFLHATRFGYNLASEELKRKDEEIAALKKEKWGEVLKEFVNQSKHLDELRYLLQSRDERIKEMMEIIREENKGGWNTEETCNRVEDLLAQSEKL